jgi:hypothetical protein
LGTANLGNNGAGSVTLDGCTVNSGTGSVAATTIGMF